MDGGNIQEIVFGADEMVKNISVTILDDDIGEGNEVIVLELDTDFESNVINVGSMNSRTDIEIIENDCKFIKQQECLFCFTKCVCVCV